MAGIYRAPYYSTIPLGPHLDSNIIDEKTGTERVK